MPADTAATQFLEKAGIPYRLFSHPGPVTSLEQAAAERNQTPNQVVRSILFRLNPGEYAMVLMPGPGQISWKALRAFFKQNRLTLADDEEVLQVTGYRIGTVNPFGLPQPVQVLIDQALLQLDEISLGSGLPGRALIIKTADLLRGIPAAQAGCFAVDRPC